MLLRFSKSILLLILGVGAVVVAGQFGIAHINVSLCDRDKFEYINRELVCDDSPVVKKHSYIEFKGEIESFIDSKKDAGNLEEAAIYFRDLQNGPTLGINEHANFAPASLLKVPLLLTYLSLAEEEPALFERKLTYHTTQNLVLEQLIQPKETVQEDITYSIRDLLKYLIKYSDNKAYIVLVKYLKQLDPKRDLFIDTIKDFGIIDSTEVLDETITVKSYSSIFTQLYHASFFDKQSTSEMALDFLVDTDFKLGLAAGVSPHIKIAHKFGERSGFDGGVKQLHDCGIIYYPENPYLLCVMTRGQDINKLTETIARISKMFYEEFNSRKI